MSSIEKNIFKGKFSKFPDNEPLNILNIDPIIGKYLLNIESRIKELETQVFNLNEKALGIHNNSEEITDTERLDFLLKNKSVHISPKCTRGLFTVFDTNDGLIKLGIGKTEIEAIDAAMTNFQRIKMKENET